MMAALMDRAANKVATQIYDYLYNSVKQNPALGQAKTDQVVRALESMKDVFHSKKGPISVMLQMPKELIDQSEVMWNKLSDYSPSREEITALQAQGKRILNRVETILERHEQLTIETIRTLKVIRVVIKYTTAFIGAFLFYLYLRRFHGSIFQTALCKFIKERKVLVGSIAGIATICFIVLSHNRGCLSQKLSCIA